MRILIRLLVPALVFIGTACANPVSSRPGAFDRNANEVFASAYQHIRNRYIDSVQLDSVALSGLGGLHEIDPAIDVKREGEQIELLRDGKQLAAFKVPGGDDTDGWASLTTAVVQTGRTYSDKLKDADGEAIYKVVFDSALARLDRYSRYASAEQARENRAQRSGFGGIGVQIRQDKGITKVVLVFPDTPAERAGLKPNDAITEVDGAALTGLTLAQVVRRLRGPSGSHVRLTIARTGTPKPLQISLTREHVIANSVIAKEIGGIAYVRVTRFNQRTAADLAHAIRAARAHLGERFKGVILDLRDNPGGLLDQAVEVSDLFVESGRIVSTEGRHPGSFQRYDAGSGDVALGRPLIVLINGRSASSSEIVAAALQDLKRAVLVGSNSFGKGTVQSVFRLPNDGELVLTWSRFHAPSGYTLQDLGVLPSVCVTGKEPNVEAVLAELRSNRYHMGETLQLWRQQRQPTHDRLIKLRNVCPSVDDDVPGADDRVLKVAQSLLDDHALYARVIELSHTAIATRREQ